MTWAKMQASEIAHRVGGRLIGADLVIVGICSTDIPAEGKLGFITRDPATCRNALNTRAVFLIGQEPEFEIQASLIVVDEPRKAFALASGFLNVASDIRGIHETAIVHVGAEIHPSAAVGPYSIVEQDCILAEDVVVEEHVVLRRGTHVGPGTTIRSGTTIGGPGFGFEVDESGIPIRIHHFGNVIIGANVEIGSNVVIARGTIDSTVISDNVKIDDHVFIAHNVKIGPRTFVIAGAEISGSVEIGEDSWIAPQVTVINGVAIGSRVTLGIGAVVIRDVPDDSIAVGNPARVIKTKN